MGQRLTENCLGLLPGIEAAYRAEPVIHFPQSPSMLDKCFKEVGIKCPKRPLRKRNGIIAKM